MKAGVRTVPWGRTSRPARAGPAAASRWNSNIRLAGLRVLPGLRERGPPLRTSAQSSGGPPARARPGPTRRTQSRARPGQDPLDLPPVHEIVRAGHLEDVLYALRPALRVEPGAPQLVRPERAV